MMFILSKFPGETPDANTAYGILDHLVRFLS